MTTLRPALAALALTGLCLAPLLPAHAAESYDNCTGFIDSLPAVISTQGTWCLRHDLATAMTDGNAITVAANNVTIDCNDFKIGGLAAGDSSNAMGIGSYGRQNVTVRHCTLRGFLMGMNILDGVGHLIEDNRVDSSLYIGLYIGADASGAIIRGNRVLDTGGYPTRDQSVAIAASGDVLDNTVDGVFAAATNSSAFGIVQLEAGGEISGNRVRGLQPGGTGWVVGIQALFGSTVAGNRVRSDSVVNGKGISAHAQAFCSGNTISRITTAIQGCQDAGGNASN